MSGRLENLLTYAVVRVAAATLLLALLVTHQARAACPDEVLNTTLPVTVSSTTLGLSNLASGSCSATSAPEKSYSYTAPLAGMYTIATTAASYDTVLYVRSSCGGSQIACDDDSGPGLLSTLTVNLAAGQTIIIFVDGSGASGTFTLSITGPCATPFGIGSNPSVGTSGTTSGASSSVGSCQTSSNLSPEKTFLYTASTTGNYVIDTEGSSFDTVLYVDDGPSCHSPEFAAGCNDDIINLVNVASRVTVPLTDGDQIYIVVDGYNGASGAFNLHVNGPACPSAIDLGNATSVTQTGTTQGGSAVLQTATCGGAPGSEKTYLYTPAVSGNYVFDTVGSAHPDTVLSIRDGNTCAGEELSCNDDVTMGNTDSELTHALDANQPVYVVVDSRSAANGAFVLHVNGPQCPTPDDLGSSLFAVDFGSLGSTGVLNTSLCGNIGTGAEKTYLYTAPVSGTYIIDTISSTIDTSLSIHSGNSCTGAELACDVNSGPNGKSKVTMHLDSEQQIYIVVDSPTGQFGTAFVHVTAPPCPDSTDLQGLPVSISGTTNAGTDLMRNLRDSGVDHCGTLNVRGSGPEKVFTYTPPLTGDYTFDTLGSSFDTVLYLRGNLVTGVDCTESEIKCNDDGGANNTSTLTAQLSAGQTVLVVVDGYDSQAFGSFNLHINGPGCPAVVTTLPSQVPVTATGDFGNFADDTYPGQCGDSPPDIGGADAQYFYTAPFTGTYIIDTGGTYPPDTVLYVRNGGDCLGQQLACNDNASMGTSDSQVTLPLAIGQTIYIAVDTFQGFVSGDFSLHISGIPMQDTDGDGIPDSTDNCDYTGNVNQEDTGGVGAGSAPDGRGNTCQCGDVNGDGRVTLADGVQIRIYKSFPAGAAPAHPELCDVGGSVGCTLNDGVIIRQATSFPPSPGLVINQCPPANP